MNNILLSLSLGLNLIMTTLVTFTYLKIPFDLDTLRKQYIDDSRYYYIRGCTTGVDYPVEFKQNGPGFNENSPISWCQKMNDEMQEIYVEGAWKLGRKK